MPDQWGFSAHWEFETGKRYTKRLDPKAAIDDDNNPYAKMAQPWHQFDFRFYKYFKIFENVNFSFLVEIENVFDALIPRIINPYTGREYRPGDILTNSQNAAINPPPNPIYNPSKFRWPRTVRFGFSFSF